MSSQQTRTNRIPATSRAKLTFRPALSSQAHRGETSRRQRPLTSPETDGRDWIRSLIRLIMLHRSGPLSLMGTRATLAALSPRSAPGPGGRHRTLTRNRRKRRAYRTQRCSGRPDRSAISPCTQRSILLLNRPSLATITSDGVEVRFWPPTPALVCRERRHHTQKAANRRVGPALQLLL